MGRPSSLNPLTHAEIVAGFSAGLTRSAIAGRAGVHPATLATWVRQGEIEELRLASLGWDVDGLDLDDPIIAEGQAAYFALYRDIRHAQDDVISEAMNTVTLAATGQLERVTVTVTENVTIVEGAPVDIGGTVTRTERGRDIRAAQFLLERLDRQRFGRETTPPEELTAINRAILHRVMNGIVAEFPELVETPEGQTKLRGILAAAQNPDHQPLQIEPGDTP
jgi:hypothetical protein